MESEVREYYDEQYQTRGLKAQRMYPNEDLIRFMARYFDREDKKDIKVLEVGCGSGANLWMLAKEGFATYGMDGSVPSLDIAKHHLQDKWHLDATLAEGSFEQIPFPDEMFDIIVDVVSLEVTDLDLMHRSLMEIYKKLKFWGVFYSYRLGDHSVMYLNGQNEYIDPVTVTSIKDPSMPLAGNPKLSFWSPSLVRIEYEKAGLQVEEIERHTRTYQNGAQTVEYLSIVSRKA